MRVEPERLGQRFLVRDREGPERQKAESEGLKGPKRADKRKPQGSNVLTSDRRERADERRRSRSVLYRLHRQSR